MKYLHNGKEIEVRAYAGSTGRDLHPDIPLTNLTIGYKPVGLIAPLIFPIVSVENETGTYYVWEKSEALRIHDAARARGDEANRINIQVSSAQYAIKNFALAADVPSEDLANADAALRLGQGYSEAVVDGLNLAWEDRIAVLLTTPANHSSNSALTNAWNDQVNGDPIEDWNIGQRAIQRTTGYLPNLTVFGFHAWDRFSRHPKVINFIRGQGDTAGGGRVSMDQAAKALMPGGGRVLVGFGVKNTAAEGATASYTDIWSTACVIQFVQPNPGIMKPSAGYTFQWTPAGLPGPLAVEQYYNQRPKTQSYEVHQFQDERVTGTDLSFLITGT